MFETSLNYSLYLKYVRAIESDTANLTFSHSPFVTMTEEQFSTMWQALPTNQRDIWLSKFQRGYHDVAKDNKAKLAAAFKTPRSKSRRAA